MKVSPWCYCTEQSSYLASEAQGPQLSGGCQGNLLDAEWMLHACVHKHTCTQRARWAQLQLGTGANLLEIYLFWLKTFILQWNFFSPLLFLSHHHVDPATGPFNPITFLLKEVSIRHDLSNGQVGIPCQKGHFQCCSSWYGDKMCQTWQWITWVYVRAHICQNRQTQCLLWFHSNYSIKYSKLHLKGKWEQRDALGLCSSFPLPFCSIAHALWTLYLKLHKPKTGAFHQQQNATNTQSDWVLYFSSLFWTYNALSYSISWRLDVVCLSLWPVLLCILTMSFSVQLTFEKSHLVPQKFLQPFK